MTKVPGARERSDLLFARGILREVLTALEAHRNALVVVGAQAVYLNVPATDLPIAATTLDADLVVDPDVLAPEPDIVDLLRRRGFRLGKNPGNYVREFDAAVADIIVPWSLVKHGRRDARLPGKHSRKAARRSQGLEAAAVDCSWMEIPGVSVDDARPMRARVAGKAALLIAKLFKLRDRLDRERVSPKDALDVHRILVATRTSELAERLLALESDRRAAEVSAAAVEYLQEQFGAESAPGPQLAARAVVLPGGEAGLPAIVAAQTSVLARRLLDELASRRPADGR